MWTDVGRVERRALRRKPRAHRRMGGPLSEARRIPRPSRMQRHTDSSESFVPLRWSLWLRVGAAVWFNHQMDRNQPPASRPVEEFAVSDVVEQVWDPGTDYSVVRLNDGPAGPSPRTRVCGHRSPVGSHVALIGHPNRVPKVVHAGPVFDHSSPLGPNRFRHQVDTIGGSSGAGVLDMDGNIVGIHVEVAATCPSRSRELGHEDDLAGQPVTDAGPPCSD